MTLFTEKTTLRYKKETIDVFNEDIIVEIFLGKLEKKIGYSFRNKKLLDLALTHSSYKNEYNAHCLQNEILEDNERLEFLGDTILSFVISKHMYDKFKNQAEGKLSQYRSILVSKDSLFKVAKSLKLVHFVRVGKSEQTGTIKEKSNILADAVEALIAAIYLDSGMTNAEKFIMRYIGHYVDKRKLARLNKNYKSALQELSQKKYKMLPVYATVEKSGKFIASVLVQKTKKARGEGKSKREAEQQAAHNLLKKLRKIKKK